MYELHILCKARLAIIKDYPIQGFSGSEIGKDTICILNNFK